MTPSSLQKIEFSWAPPDNFSRLLLLEKSCGTTWSHSETFFEESLRYGRVLVASDGDTLVAYLLYEIIWGNTAFLSLLKVLPAYQRNGIGKTMVAELEKRLVSLGFKSYVTSSETTNPNTKRFFPGLGFNLIGQLQMFHGEEMFYLKKLGSTPVQ